MSKDSTTALNDLRRILGWTETNQGIELLRALDENGSINSAARVVGVSYKAAWQKLDQFNNLVSFPLLRKQTGGRGGGGSELTEEGRLLLHRIGLMEREMGQFMEFFSDDPEAALNTLKTLRRIEMNISARNLWLGQVLTIEKGAVNSVVTIKLKGGDIICSVITDNSVVRLGLEPGVDVMAIVKAPSVLLGHDVEPDKISARNILVGTITNVITGAVNDEVTMDLPGGSTVTSIITSNSARRLSLKVGDSLSAIIKASDVLLAIV